jgi:hypothetical protein
MSTTAALRDPRRLLADHWPVAAVVCAYLGSILLLPRANVPVGDDWFYAETVRRLVDGEGFHILDATVVTLILPALWGALFASVFGTSFVVLRWSSVALVAIGGVAVYALCRTLGASRRWSALGAAIVLFNPLGYVLSNSFMSDAPFTAVLAVAGLLYVRGLTCGAERRRVVIAASVAAAAAFLVRQQGALIPMAVGVHLLLGRRLRVDRASLWLLLRVGGIPALTGLVYVIWLRLVHGVPASQNLFVEEAGFLFKPAMIGLAARLVFLCLVYSGLFVLPVAAVAALGGGRLVRSVPRRGWLLYLVPAAVVVVGAVHFAREDRLMPYVPQYVADWGLGPADLIGGRPPVVGRDALIVLTLAAVAAALVWLLALSRAAAPQPARFGAGGAKLLVAILVGQAVGIVPPSLHFQNPVPAAVLVFTLDRYLLPLLPLVVCLAVWAVGDLRLFQDAVWNTATEAERAGVPVRQLDGGAQWDAVRLYRDGVEVPESLPDRPWWVNQFAWDLDPRWIVSSSPVPGYVEVTSHTYDTWLRPHDKRIFLLRRQDVPPPP